MFNLIEWLEENILHTTVCDKEKRETMMCVCGKTQAINIVLAMQKKIKAQKAYIEELEQ